jgi:hypothetical protein
MDNLDELVGSLNWLGTVIDVGCEGKAQGALPTAQGGKPLVVPIEPQSNAELAQVGAAIGVVSLLFGGTQCRKQQCRENCDDHDGDEQLRCSKWARQPDFTSST